MSFGFVRSAVSKREFRKPKQTAFPLWNIVRENWENLLRSKEYGELPGEENEKVESIYIEPHPEIRKLKSICSFLFQKENCADFLMD